MTGRIGHSKGIKIHWVRHRHKAVEDTIVVGRKMLTDKLTITRATAHTLQDRYRSYTQGLHGYTKT